ncbi:putative trna splicing endonuclease subunit protein [Botrytis fragariae]|uniref:Putative trna splicing endonuclease subunit protein n=1 Tax=Botrytis fragariae TaxID=1964551 RepID=A0A8H6EEM3_9HELO|nr:putative trna splicing endonuclease subunit protein [Botrytis fragariae]KAF5869085.1 putative trna splicing endonuclease subunit protein [Botrytis fragariae]
MNDRPKEEGQIAKSMAMNSDTLQSITSVPPVINQPKPSQPTFGSSNIKSIDLYSDSDDEPKEDKEVEIRSARQGTAEEVITVSSYPKRNLPSVNYDEGIWSIKIRSPKRTKLTPTQSIPKLHGVIVGTWKDSEQFDDHDKHIVHGFIDDGGRLRFRIYGTNRQRNKSLAIPPGAYGCWVKFQNIAFDPYLSTKTPDQIKEYVIFKSQENQKQSDGIPRVSRDVDDDASAKVNDIQSSSKPEILLGFWADSNQVDIKDKHAVFGTIVLNSNHKFRFMIRKSTRDGRFVLGNFPVGAGNYQAQYENIVLEEYLSKLKRSEVEQYILIRQREILEGGDRDSRSQQLNAVKLAKAAAASKYPSDPSLSGHDISNPDLEIEQSLRRKEISRGKIADRKEPPHLQGTNDISVDFTLEEKPAPYRKFSAERQLAKSMNKLNKTWEAQQEAKTQQPVTSPHSEAIASGSSLTNDNDKIHNGIKYTRRQNGVFEGKHVGPPQLLNIDGEDYVEYRVLTKAATF